MHTHLKNSSDYCILSNYTNVSQLLNLKCLMLSMGKLVNEQHHLRTITPTTATNDFNTVQDL